MNIKPKNFAHAVSNFREKNQLIFIISEIGATQVVK